MDVHADLNRKQRVGIRWLAPHIDGNPVEKQTIVNATGLTDSEYGHLISSLVDARAVEIVIADTGVYASDILVTEGLHKLVFQLDRRPDRWKQFGGWFRSYWWSVPLILLAIGAVFVIVNFASIKEIWESIRQ